MWADIVKLHKPSNSDLPTSMMEKIQATQKMLDQQQLRFRVEPVPEAVYFKNLRRGPIGSLRRALRKCLPAWAILGLSFVGGSILEIVTDRRQRDRLVTTMKIMGIIEVPNFVIKKAAKAVEGNGGSGSLDSRNETALVRRLNYCIEHSRSFAATRWYERKLAEMRPCQRETSRRADKASRNTTMEMEVDYDEGPHSPDQRNPKDNNVEDGNWTTVHRIG